MQNSNDHLTGTSSLKTIFIKNSFQHKHDQFVVAPVDKANKNAAFICRQFCNEVLIKEFGIDGISSNTDKRNLSSIAVQRTFSYWSI